MRIEKIIKAVEPIIAQKAKSSKNFQEDNAAKSVSLLRLD